MRTLIVYATKHGSAEKCAKLLASQLSGETVLCHLGKDKEPDLKEFDQIIVGGSIYVGKIRPKAANFIKRNQAVLLNKKLGLFVCCMATGSDAETEIKAVFPPELQNHASFVGSLGGGFNFSNMNWLEKKMIIMINNKTAGAQPVTGDQDIDQIDGEAISRFAAVFNGT